MEGEESRGKGVGEKIERGGGRRGRADKRGEKEGEKERWEKVGKKVR